MRNNGNSEYYKNHNLKVGLNKMWQFNKKYIIFRYQQKRSIFRISKYKLQSKVRIRCISNSINF